ncbi:MAG: metallophosphoesterase [Clostridia bacterium]|nr:metallophosphoesterase [Clostridia bacterium]
MKTIAVLSDTHGNYDAIEKIMPVLESCDFVAHLGDRFTDMQPYKKALGDKLVCVKGNCDFTAGDVYRILEVEGKRLLFTHGDAFGVKYSLTRLALFAEEQRADAVFFGHTHAAFEETRGGVLFVNPGALARTSFEKTFAFVTVTESKIVSCHNRTLA